MPFKLSRLLPTLALTVASGLLAAATHAQEVETVPVPDAFVDALNEESGDYFRNSTLIRQFDFIVGPGLIGSPSFLDTELTRDGKRVHELYRYMLDLQVSSDPVIRTPDLANPFDSSLRLNPSLRANPINSSGTIAPGSEFIFQVQPF